MSPVIRSPGLSTAQRLAVAKVSGAVQRLVLRDGRGTDAVDEVLAESRDPLVLGDALGAVLARLEHLPSLQPAVELLRAAGADEERAAVKAAWLRERYPNDLL